METLFNHKKQKDTFMLFFNKDGENKPIRFYNTESAYSGTPTHSGGFNPIEIDKRTIEETTFEKATKMLNLSEFAFWQREAKNEFEKFLEDNDLFISDIKVCRVKYVQPKEEIFDFDFSLILNRE